MPNPVSHFQLEVVGESSDFDVDLDKRQWTQQHLEAANIPHPSILALTPPQAEDQSEARDVDVRGPDGFTPLMLASFRGGGLDTGVDDDTSGSGSTEGGDADIDRSADVITGLLIQGAAINAQTDRTGKSNSQRFKLHRPCCWINITSSFC